MESYIVRIYREDKNNPRSFVGIVEEVGVEERKAFTNLDELWNILNSIKKETKTSNKEIVFKREKEKRDEMRTKKEIPFVFIYNKRKLSASTVNYSKNGFGIRIDKKIALPVGNIFNLQTKDLHAKAEIRWVDDKSNPSITTAGFHILNGNLNLKGAKKDMHLVMRGR